MYSYKFIVKTLSVVTSVEARTLLTERNFMKFDNSRFVVLTITGVLVVC